MPSVRYLTKSRFKLAVECPTKLFYADKRDYKEAEQEGAFLAVLAEGGYQFGELLKWRYPAGVASPLIPKGTNWRSMK